LNRCFSVIQGKKQKEIGGCLFWMAMDPISPWILSVFVTITEFSWLCFHLIQPIASSLFLQPIPKDSPPTSTRAKDSSLSRSVISFHCFRRPGSPHLKRRQFLALIRQQGYSQRRESLYSKSSKTTHQNNQDWRQAQQTSMNMTGGE
jgi:hypothetical protein